MGQFFLDTFPVGLFQCNCTILIPEGSKGAFIVDPGDEAELILQKLDHFGVGVSGLWHTHAHIDHVGATKALYDKYLVRNREFGLEAPKVYLHREDVWLYQHIDVQSQMLGLSSFEVPQITEWIREGQTYEGLSGVSALTTPGHTPGSCCLCVEGSSNLHAPKSFSVGRWEQIPQVILSGDTLFRRGIGRTDLWGGDSQKIEKSIQKKLYTKSPEAVVIPGHGPLTVIEQEMAKNPFVRALED